MHLVLAAILAAPGSVSAPADPAPRPAPAAAAASARPVVLLETSLGSIKIALDREKAPLTVDNFLKYVRAKHYDGTIFHRVIPGFMIQGGGFDASMQELPTRKPIRNESKNGLRNLRGTIAMARTGDPHSATAQFFINVKDNLFLNQGDGYAVFGEVVEGMDVVDRIVAVPTATRFVGRVPHENVPKTAVGIKKATLQAAADAAPAAVPARPAPRPAP